ncbi:MAG: AbrB/MazE/SpoVT family DNA-binding domain-containing protein [Ignavibacteria bacterium]|nr:AbrB/MazE/SpoVT family DNA-binding domain-containing protein [Ignavibacteria bacterium]
METSSLTIKGQIVVPSKIRKKLGLKKGSKVGFIEMGDKVILQPLDKRYFKSLIGIGGTKGIALKSLLNDKKKEKNL